MHETPEMRRERRIGAERFVFRDHDVRGDPEFAKRPYDDHVRLPS